MNQKKIDTHMAGMMAELNKMGGRDRLKIAMQVSFSIIYTLLNGVKDEHKTEVKAYLWDGFAAMMMRSGSDISIKEESEANNEN